MILSKATEAAAQELADRCHAYLIANDAAYAASVAAGQTLRWAIPAQDDGTGLWAVVVDDRCLGALTPEEYTLPSPEAL